MIRRGLVILLAMASLTWAAQQPSQDPKPPAQAAPNAKADSPPGPELDIQQMVKETEQFDMRPHKMAIFWWIPPDYWDAALRQQGYNSERVRNVFKPFRDYNVFMIAVGNMESSGMNWAKEPEVKKNVLLRDQRGTSYKPLADVPLEISGIIDLMRPVFKNMMGNFGEGLQFIVFPVRDDAGNIFADAHKSSEIYLDVSDLLGVPKSTYTWRFPLTALMPAKFCPVGKEKVEASWKYCPWHGNKLEEASATPAATAAPAKPAN